MRFWQGMTIEYLENIPIPEVYNLINIADIVNKEEVKANGG